MLDDVSIDVLQSALRGLSAREQAISDNIANVNTPYFTARRVEFESALRRAVAEGADPMGAPPSAFLTSDPAGLNGNNVDLNAETVLSAQTQMAYDLAARAVGDRFTLVRTAIRGA
jgi:flagellar basal-body rod protein FlgB